MAKLVSKTYGDALFSLAKQENRMDEFFGQAQGLVEILKNNQELMILMDQPKIVKKDKIKMIEEIFAGKVAKELIGLMILLIEKNHYADINDVFMYFIDEVKEEKGIGKALVSTPVALTEKQKSDVEKRLLETTKYTLFEMAYIVDTTLIGGMVIRIGDKVVDTSVKNKLYDLTKELRNIKVAIEAI